MELIGSLIKYPFAVHIFVELASKLKPKYTAKSLVDVLLETAVGAAHCLTLGSKIEERCRGQIKVLDAQGVCRFHGLPRILQKLGLLRKLTDEAAAALSHRFRGRIRRWKSVQGQSHKHSGRKLRFGTSSYVLLYNVRHATNLLEMVRQHGPAPLLETSACVTHIKQYQDMLRKFPRSWSLHPDHKGSARKRQSSGQARSTKYQSAWVQRKHVFSQLHLRTGTAWPPGADVDMRWLRSWCPDSNDRLGDYEDSMRLDVLEMKAGCHYRLLSMWLCLVGPLMQMHADVKQFLKDPGNLETCLEMIREHRERAGIPPTLELLGKIIWRKIVRGVASSRAARATGSGAAPKPGRKRKRPAAAKTAAVAAEEAQKSEAEKGGQEKPRKVRKRKKGAEEEKEERAEEGAEKGEGGEKEGAEEGEEEEAEKGEEMERLDNAQEAEEGEEEAAHEETESRDAEEVEEKEAEEVEEVEPEKVEKEEAEPEKVEKQPSRTQTQQRKRKTKKP